jgi:predicted Zn finger-like uncharacterized protein
MYTRCPQCDTVYRVTPQQLQASSGQVRCGRCQAVFDAFAALSATPPARGTASAQAEPLPEVTPAAPTPGPASAAPTPGSAPASSLRAPSAEAPSAPPADTSAAPAARRPTARRDPGVERLADASLTLPDELFQPELIAPAQRWAWLAANLLLLCAFAGQAAWQFATPIAMHAPVLAPALETYCEWLGCRFGLPRLPEQLFIEASDLQLLDAARPGRVLLTATIRNRAAHAQAFPMLELTLTGADNQTAARRVFAPAEYLDPGLDAAGGIGPQQEVSIKLYLDTLELRATGYRLYLFFA